LFHGPTKFFAQKTAPYRYVLSTGPAIRLKSSLKSDRGSAGAPGRKRAIPLDRVRAWRRGLNAVAEHFL
jgi:hypothetical protein